MKHLFLFLIAIILFQHSYSQPSVHLNQSFKVLSWNIYMLPPLIKFTGKMSRANKIAEVLTKESYDMIVFQEAFHSGARRRILKGLKSIYPYAIGPANRIAGSFKTSSGVWILSKTPITKLGSIKFTECYGFSDCQARKGALMVETDWNGQKIQVLGTHIQAAGDKELKLRQVAELSEKLVIPNKKDGVPQLLCGDFNLSDLDTNAQNRMLACCKAQNGLLSGDICYTKDINGNNDLEPDNKNRKVLDYILIRDNGKSILETIRRVRIFESPWHRKHKDLSDHYAVEAEVRF